MSAVHLQLLCEDHREGGHGERPVHLHCGREDGGPNGQYTVSEGRIRSNHFLVFPYFDDVNDGDGGLLVLPGSHKSLFERPEQLYGTFVSAYRLLCVAAAGPEPRAVR